jgi:hypothetical protein
MAHMMPSTCTARHAARPPRAQDCRTLVRLSSAWQKKQEIFEAIQRAAAAFGRRVTVAVAEDADLTQLRVRSNAWLDQSSNKAHDSLGLLGSSYILRLLKRWSVGSMEMESVQLTAAAQKFSSRGTAAPRKVCQSDSNRKTSRSAAALVLTRSGHACRCSYCSRRRRCTSCRARRASGAFRSRRSRDSCSPLCLPFRAPLSAIPPSPSPRSVCSRSPCPRRLGRTPTPPPRKRRKGQPRSTRRSLRSTS